MLRGEKKKEKKIKKKGRNERENRRNRWERQTDWVHQLEKPDVSCRAELPRQQHHVMIWKREERRYKVGNNEPQKKVEREKRTNGRTQGRFSHLIDFGRLLRHFSDIQEKLRC
jgi:hypothetical protein